MSSPCKVLVVDDEPLLKSLINQKFRVQINARHLEFHFAADGVEALEKLEKDKEIAVVITDIRMPRMDGLTLLSHLNKQTRIYKTIVISAFGDMHNVRKAMAEGANDFILKPFDIMDFEFSLMNAVQLYKLAKRDIETKNKLDQFSKELLLAKQLKEAYQPVPFIEEVIIKGEMLPKSDLRSDYFDFYPVDKNRLGIVLADFTSRGIPLAFNTSKLQMLARGSILSETDPETIHKFLTKEMGKEITGLFFGFFDVLSKQLSYCCMGDVVLYSMSDRGFEKIDSKHQTLTLTENEKLLLTTKKLSKLQNDGNVFGELQFKQDEPIKDVLQKVKSDVLQFLGNKSPDVNIPLLCIQAK